MNITFVDKCIAGEISIGVIDDYIDQWHDSKSEDSIYTFLGMTGEEYSQWVEHPESLKDIIESRKKNIIWTYEKILNGTFSIGFATKKVLYHKRSQYQDIKVIDTYSHGKVLFLDDCVMFTERDEFVYHEMMAHVPLCSLEKDNIKVLVIGGGDGGVVREVLKHKNVEQVVLCEIDREVIDTCVEYFPEINGGYWNKTECYNKVTIECMDGFEYLKNHKNEFDLILVDSTDPVGPAEVLAKEPFYKLVYDALTVEGIMVAQSESPWYDGKWRKDMYEEIGKVFHRNVSSYIASIPTYPSGLWSFCFASKRFLEPSVYVNLSKVEEISKTTKYFSDDAQINCFDLPKVALNDLPDTLLNRRGSSYA